MRRAMRPRMHVIRPASEGDHEKVSHKRITLREVLRAAGPFPVHNPLSQTSGEDARPFDMLEIAERFRDLRRRCPVRMTQARLAGLLGVGRQALNRIECARTTPHPTTWNRFRELERRYEEAAKLQLPKHWF